MLSGATARDTLTEWNLDETDSLHSEINSIVYAMESLMVVLDDVPLDAEEPESVENFANHEFRLKKVVDAIQSVMM